MPLTYIRVINEVLDEQGARNRCPGIHPRQKMVSARNAETRDKALAPVDGHQSGGAAAATLLATAAPTAQQGSPTGRSMAPLSPRSTASTAVTSPGGGLFSSSEEADSKDEDSYSDDEDYPESFKRHFGTSQTFSTRSVILRRPHRA